MRTSNSGRCETSAATYKKPKPPKPFFRSQGGTDLVSGVETASAAGSLSYLTNPRAWSPADGGRAGGANGVCLSSIGQAVVGGDRIVVGKIHGCAFLVGEEPVDDYGPHRAIRLEAEVHGIGRGLIEHFDELLIVAETE